MKEQTRIFMTFLIAMSFSNASFLAWGRTNSYWDIPACSIFTNNLLLSTVSSRDILVFSVFQLSDNGVHYFKQIMLLIGIPPREDLARASENARLYVERYPKYPNTKEVSDQTRRKEIWNYDFRFSRISLQKWTKMLLIYWIRCWITNRKG